MQLADQINLGIAIISACSTLASLAVVVATFRILQANRDTVSVMREQIRSMSRPYVQVRPWVRVGVPMLMLTIENSGASSANNLVLSLDKDFHVNGESGPGRNLRSLSAFSKMIDCLPPKAEINFHLGVGHVVFQDSSLCPLSFTVTAEYEFDSEKVVERTVVDLQPFQYSVPPVDAVAEQIEKLTEVATKIEKSMR